MKLKELKAVLNALGDRYDDWDLVIPLAQPSVGAVATCRVRSIGMGFDWEHGMAMLHPEGRLTEKTKPQDVYDGALDLLLWLATKPTKRESYEMRRAKRILLRAGYAEEDIKQYQKYLHQGP